MLSSLFVVLLASPAWAIEKAGEPPESGGWIAMIIAIVLMIAVCVGSFMSSRRGHQD